MIVISHLATPEPAPTVIVEIASDPTMTMAGLIVSIVSALVGAIAAVASWRAATAAQKATASGDEAARHAAEAASAAIRSAEYQRATFESEREARLMTHAEKVFVVSTAWYDPREGTVKAQVKVENRGGAPITEVAFGVTFGGGLRTAMQQVDTIAAGGRETRVIYLADVKREQYDRRKIGGVAHFRDSNGLRWERREGRAPTGLDDQVSRAGEPGSGGRA